MDVYRMPSPTSLRGIAFDVNVPGRVEIDIYSAADHRRLNLPADSLSIHLVVRDEYAVVRLTPAPADPGCPDLRRRFRIIRGVG